MQQPLDSSPWMYIGKRFLASAAAFAGAASLFSLLLLPALPMSAQQVKVTRELKHDVSPPMHSLTSAAPAVADTDEAEPEEDFPGTSAKGVSPVDDPVLQRTASTKLLATLGMNVLGLGSGFTGPQGTFQFAFAPPDPNAAVGATQVVETVNLSWAVFDKTSGATLLGPVSIASIWSGFNASARPPENPWPTRLCSTISKRRAG